MARTALAGLGPPATHLLAAGLTHLGRTAATAWDQGRPGQARDGLAAALTLARDLRYL